MANIKDIIEKPHPAYLRNVDYWNFLLDSYEGGADYTRAFIKSQTSNSGVITVKVNGKPLESTRTSNLFEHAKELSSDYQKRIDMSYYYNFCAPVIDIYTNHLFGQAVVEDFGSIESVVEERSQNIDQKGSSIEEYRKQVAESMQIFGHTYTLVDSPVYSENIITLQDKIENGVFPYFTNIQPQNILNWSLDRFGRPYWVLVLEVNDENADYTTFNSEFLRGKQYRIWTRTEWILFNSKYEEVDRAVHGLGFVPIAVAYDRKSKKEESFLGISFISDISFIARDVYNSCSELKQILRDQTFSILAIQGDSTNYPAIEVATNKGLLVPKDSQMPQYITPPAGPADTLMKHIDGQISRIFQLAKLEGGSASYSGQTAEQQSGVSKAWDFNQTNSALTTKASNMEDAETKMWQMWAAWEGFEFDGSIAYPREFSVKSLKEELNEAEQSIRLNISNEFNKEIKRTIVQKKFPRLPEDKLKKIEKEIESTQMTDGGRLGERVNGLLNRTPTGGNNGGFTK